MYYGSEDVQCPFYKGETKNSLKCEGVFALSCINNFTDKAAKNRHKEQYCNAKYQKCPHCKALMFKYAQN